MDVKLQEMNIIWEKIDILYHEAAREYGLSDADFHVLYILSGVEGYFPQKMMYNLTGISKTTINSAIKKMESEGIIELKAIDGRSTQVGLTDEGKKLSAESVEKIIEIENRIYDGWTEEERRTMISINRKYMEQFEEELEKLKRR